MARNPYFSQGTKNEQYLIEDLIIESLKIFGNQFYYIPRSLVAKDEILGEDRLSEFKNAYPIEMYFENIDTFGGQGFMVQKFGLMIEQSATLVVSRRRWTQLVGRTEQSILPNRPAEGDLIYFPLSDGLFEIKFVQHQDPFYQLGKLYVYKLQVELFQYASERITTGIEDIDIFESLKSYDISNTQKNTAGTISVTNNSATMLGTDTLFTSELSVGDEIVINTVGYKVTEILNNITINVDRKYAGVTGTDIEFTVSNLDNISSYGDNWNYKEKSPDVIFNSANPFGEL